MPLQKRKWMSLIMDVSFAIFVVRGIVYLIIEKERDLYNAVKLPKFSLPSHWFSVIWIIIYTLIGFSVWLARENYKKNKKISLSVYHNAVFVYYIHLTLNILWSILFFKLKLFFVSFLLMLIIFALVNIICFWFYKISKPAAVIVAVYVLWLFYLTFALSLPVTILN